jgi:hypothetical protein
MKHLLNNNKKHTTVKGNNMAMKPKKRTSPKIAPIIPPIVGAIAGAAGRAAGRGAAKKVGKNIVKRKATGIRDAKGLRKMEKALSGSKGPKRTTPASKPTSQLERNIGRHSALRKKFPEKYNPTVKKKVSNPDSPFLDLVKPVKRNTKAIQEALKRAAQGKNKYGSRGEINLDFKRNQKFKRGK